MLARALPPIAAAQQRANASARRYRQIAALRHAGLAIAWSTALQWADGAPLVFGANCKIGRHSMIAIDVSPCSGRAGSLAMGDQVQIGDYNNIRPAECSVRIGSRVLFSQFVSVLATNHLVEPDGRISWHEIDPSKQDVTIEDDCWIGAHAVILAGVTVAERTIVGAGAVVTKSFPAGSRLVGVPARCA
jgi:acetyltransferase-like isoleucine patch superfamily enzyme